MKVPAALMMAGLGLSAADRLEVFGYRWTVPVASDWKADQEDGVPVLRLWQSRGPVPGPRRPIQFALADTPRLFRNPAGITWS